MESCSPIKDFFDRYAAQNPQFEEFKNEFFANPLVDRITKNWQAALLDCSTVIAVCAFIGTFFTGSALLCTAFAITAGASGIGAFYMRKFATLSDLETTAKELKETKERLEKVASDLENENNRLAQTNRDLQQTNASFQATNRDLQGTNNTLKETNNRLTTQVTQLTLQVTQLRESADRIKTELLRFQQENQHLHYNVQGFDQSLRVLDQQILASGALCDQIAQHLSTQQQGLGDQLNQIKQYLSELRAENRVHERIQELAALQQQLAQATTQLHNTQLQYATERANFQAIHEALCILKTQFDEVVSNMQSNNQAFRNNISSNQQQIKETLDALTADREKIQQMLNRYNTPPVLNQGR